MNKPTLTKNFDQLVLSELKKKSLTTYDIRKIGPFHPAGVISRLRKKYKIETTRVTVKDEHGIEHSGVACYTLEKAEGESNE